jgi:hypothetical protein
MVYKKYIYKDGKRFGPYYYESYRDKDGKVRKKYVKREEVEGGNNEYDIFHKKLVMSGIFIFILGLIGLLFFGGFFEKVLFSDESGYGLKGAPIWECSLCENGIRICNDESGYGYESYSEDCVEEELELKERFDLSNKESEKIERGCEVDLECGEWEECKIDYSLDSLIYEEVFLGKQIRKCVDKGGCILEKIEKRECNIITSVVVKEVDKCFKEYVEVRDEEGNLISRLELVEGNSDVLNVDISGDEGC